MMLTFIWIGCLSFVAMAAMIGWQVWSLRSGRIERRYHPSVAALLQPKVDQAALHLTAFCAGAARYLSLKFLSAVRWALSGAQHALMRAERRFARAASAVKGKSAATQRGSVSFFLRDTEEGREASIAQR